MGTKIRVNHNPTDDLDSWEEEYPEEESRRMPRGQRRREIEDRLAERHLRKQIEDSYYFD